MVPVLFSVVGGLPPSCSVSAVFQLMEEKLSGVGIVKWPVAQLVGKQALRIKLSLY